jgi:UDP-glucuronate 4-epimerase
MKVLVTGCAGFIGMYVAERLLARGDTVVGIDKLNDYYDVALNEARLARLAPNPAFRFVKLDRRSRGHGGAVQAGSVPTR